MTDEGRGLNVRRTSDGVRFAIHVTPRARTPRVGGLHGGALRVAVAAAPVDGAANRAVVLALVEALGLRRGTVVVVSGERGRSKGIVARGNPEQLEARLRELANG